jgi:hypothetical protein
MPLLGSLEDSPRRRRRLNALHEQEEERLTAQDGRVACDDTGVDDLASTSNWMRRAGEALIFPLCSQSAPKEAEAVDPGEIRRKAFLLVSILNDRYFVNV